MNINEIWNITTEIHHEHLHAFLFLEKVERKIAYLYCMFSLLLMVQPLKIYRIFFLIVTNNSGCVLFKRSATTGNSLNLKLIDFFFFFFFFLRERERTPVCYANAVWIFKFYSFNFDSLSSTAFDLIHFSFLAP